MPAQASGVLGAGLHVTPTPRASSQTANEKGEETKNALQRSITGKRVSIHDELNVYTPTQTNATPSVPQTASRNSSPAALPFQAKRPRHPCTKGKMPRRDVLSGSGDAASCNRPVRSEGSKRGGNKAASGRSQLTPVDDRKSWARLVGCQISNFKEEEAAHIQQH